MQQITNSVFVEMGKMACSLGVIKTDKGNILIDSPMQAAKTLEWREIVDKLGEVKYLVNTENHGDHWQGDYFLPGTLITHDYTAQFLKRTPLSRVMEAMRRMYPDSLPLMKDYAIRIPDISFTDMLSINLGNLTFKLFHTPGHAAGGLCLYFPEESVIFCGDIIFGKTKTFLQEAVPEQWLESLNRLYRLDVEKIIPGHGEICTKEYIRSQAEVIVNWRTNVTEAIKKGWTLKEAQDRITSPDPYKMDADDLIGEKQLNDIIIERLFNYYGKK